MPRAVARPFSFRHDSDSLRCAWVTQISLCLFIPQGSTESRPKTTVMEIISLFIAAITWDRPFLLAYFIRHDYFPVVVADFLFHIEHATVTYLQSVLEFSVMKCDVVWKACILKSEERFFPTFMLNGVKLIFLFFAFLPLSWHTLCLGCTPCLSCFA